MHVSCRSTKRSSATGSGSADRSRRCAAASRVLGTGAMGSVVAQLLAAVGFEVHGWSRRSGEPLESVLAAADIVVCALPLTPATTGICSMRVPSPACRAAAT